MGKGFLFSTAHGGQCNSLFGHRGQIGAGQPVQTGALVRPLFGALVARRMTFAERFGCDYETLGFQVIQSKPYSPPLQMRPSVRKFGSYLAEIGGWKLGANGT